jgi:hypothetical protein|nr:MAG TPA: Major tail protein [Caudoviricetes sp.]
MFTPTTALRLLDTPLESDYRNTLWFPDREAQTAYFLGKTIKTYENFQYIKKNNTIVVDGEVDLLYNCNYIMYQNNNFTNKWFYAFIDRIEWASNSSVRLYVSTDVIQTWFFDITYYDSYVDRCHSDTDVAGDNIVPEDFSVGNPGGYQVAGSTDLAPDGIALFATSTYAGESRTGSVNSGIYSGGQNLVDFHIDNPGVGSILDSYVKNGTATAVIKLQQYPYKLKNGPMVVSFSKYPSSISGYTPKNNKMLSSAFVTCFMSMYGQETDFNPVFITDSKVNIKVSADQTSGTISAFVENYSDGSISTISMFASIPESGWSYNQYKNDYNLHSGSNAIYVQRSVAQRTADYVSAGTNTAASVLDTAGSIFRTGVSLVGATGVPALGLSKALENIGSTARSFGEANQALTALNSFAGGYDSISQDLATISENYNAPATGGMSASNGYIATGKTVFSYGYKVLPRDIVERCDKFLTVYGYKQSEYRAINLHARASWTYIKTNGLNASGNFPDDDMNIIKRAFNNGIFFWVYTATYGNFGQNNAIV